MPIRIVFWVKPYKLCRILHETPLFMIPGVTVASWCIDLLHAWHLGPLARYVAMVCWLMIRSRVLVSKACAHLDKETTEKLGLLGIKTLMWAYYKEQRRDDPDWAKKNSEVMLIIIFGLAQAPYMALPGLPRHASC